MPTGVSNSQKEWFCWLFCDIFFIWAYFQLTLTVSSDADDFEPADSTARAKAADDKWEGEDEEEDVKVGLIVTLNMWAILIGLLYCVGIINPFDYPYITSNTQIVVPR